MATQFSPGDKEILRRLAEQYAAIAALPIQEERREIWRGINDLKPHRPGVYAYQLPWNELNVNDELTPLAEGGFARGLEMDLRRKIYLHTHLDMDVVAEDTVYCPLAVGMTPVLPVLLEDCEKIDATSSIASRHYKDQLKTEEDIQKIKNPVVTHDEALSAERFAAYQEIFADLLPVEQRGAPAFRLSIWDRIVEWTSIEGIMMDLIMRPDYVHAICERATQAYSSIVDQYEELGLIPNCNNDACTSDGALGYTRELPKDKACCTKNLWGGAAAQIFGEVSPDMHEEFALQYEKRYLDRFGLAYYGCCEPLHLKVEKIRKNVPNLRKISCSPWADVASMAEQCGQDLVVSIKPNPASLAEDKFNGPRVREYLEERLELTRGCAVEFVLKDVSTVRYDPERLWEWCRIAKEVVEK